MLSLRLEESGVHSQPWCWKRSECYHILEKDGLPFLFGVECICVGRGASLPFAFEEDGISEELRSGPLWWKETEYVLVRGLSFVLKEGVVQS